MFSVGLCPLGLFPCFSICLLVSCCIFCIIPLWVCTFLSNLMFSRECFVQFVYVSFLFFCHVSLYMCPDPTESLLALLMLILSELFLLHSPCIYWPTGLLNYVCAYQAHYEHCLCCSCWHVFYYE